MSMCNNSPSFSPNLETWGYCLHLTPRFVSLELCGSIEWASGDVLASIATTGGINDRMRFMNHRFLLLHPGFLHLMTWRKRLFIVNNLGSQM